MQNSTLKFNIDRISLKRVHTIKFNSLFHFAQSNTKSTVFQMIYIPLINCTYNQFVFGHTVHDIRTVQLDLCNTLFPKAHNSECQNLPFPWEIKPVQVSLKLSWRIFGFFTFGTNGLSVSRTGTCEVRVAAVCWSVRKTDIDERNLLFLSQGHTHSHTHAHRRTLALQINNRYWPGAPTQEWNAKKLFLRLDSSWRLGGGRVCSGQHSATYNIRHM